ncbi:MAG: hypothetical protein COB53_03500 [Elusimicrobia bacterium]|nr:MAG: hypothetical protein COB53_03500 [Elusimicrobiota bacterium]
MITQNCCLQRALRRFLATSLVFALLTTQQGFFVLEALAGGMTSAPTATRISAGSFNAAGPGMPGGSISQLTLGVSMAPSLSGALPETVGLFSLPTVVPNQAAVGVSVQGNRSPSRVKRVNVSGPTVGHRRGSSFKEIVTRARTKPKTALGRLQGLKVTLGRAIQAVSLRRFFDAQLLAGSDPALAVALNAADPTESRLAAPTTEDTADAAAVRYERVQALKQILGDGTFLDGQRIGAFGFRQIDGKMEKASTAGLEGFLYKKLEHEAKNGAAHAIHQIDDYFAFLDALLSPVETTTEFRRGLRTLRYLDMDGEQKNRELNELLISQTGALREELVSIDASQWGRWAHTHYVLARDQSLLKPGKNLFESLDDAWLDALRTEVNPDEIWLGDIFELGDDNNWGSGGGSPYAVKGYERVRAQYGGNAGFEDFIKRAHAKGYRVRSDLIPNHTSLDSDLVAKNPDAYFHLLPPQDLSDEEIMAGVPHEPNPDGSLRPYKITTRDLPGRIGIETTVDILFLRNEQGESLWVDWTGLDVSRTEARDWLREEGRRRFDADAHHGTPPVAIPLFRLAKVQNYPGREGVETRIVLHHPRTDFGDVTWIDMAQIDYSRPAAREWILDQTRNLLMLLTEEGERAAKEFESAAARAQDLKALYDASIPKVYGKEASIAWDRAQGLPSKIELVRDFNSRGIDSMRRDMAYYVLNEGYYDRWLTIFEAEAKDAHGWARDEMARMVDEFKQRWAKLDNSEILAEITNAGKTTRPDAVFHDENYGYSTGLSETGSDGVYGKNTQDTSMGQYGLYDAMRSRDPWTIAQAQRYNLFRMWQLGAATIVNFVGNHDEMNWVDRLGSHWKAGVVTALLGGAVISQSGQELGTNQHEMLSDTTVLSDSIDRGKGIPFDIPVSVDRSKINGEKAGVMKLAWQKHDQYKSLYRDGVGQVLDAHWKALNDEEGNAPVEGFPIVAWTVGHGNKAILAAANWGAHEIGGFFRLDGAKTSLGAFIPEKGKTYRLTDQLSEVEVIATGQKLLEEGLYIQLPAGGAHIFEISEVESASTLQLRDPASSNAADAVAASAKKSFWKAPWSTWVTRGVYFALVPFVLLQLPQILTNFENLATDPAKISILPWIGYSTGILANLNLFGYYTSLGADARAKGDKKAYRGTLAIAMVQAVGAATTFFVLGQIYMAGYAPAIALGVVGTVLGVGLVINIAKWLGRLPEKTAGINIFTAWGKIGALMGLFALPLGASVTFNLMNAHPIAVLAASFGMAGLGGLAMYFDAKKKLPDWLSSSWAALGAWLGTMLFLFLPIPQLVNNFSDPGNIAGIAIGTLMLSVGGNLLEVNGAMHHKNKIWMTGAFWSISVGGWAILLTMMIFGAVSPSIFWAFTLAVPAALWFIVHQNMKANGESSYRETLSFMLPGSLNPKNK